jgi:hypothetical protein
MNLLENRYKRSENVIFREVGDETILVPIKGNVADLSFIYTLTEVAAFIWAKIDGRRKLIDIKNMIMAEYDVSSDNAEKDLLELIGQLEQIGSVFKDNR